MQREELSIKQVQKLSLEILKKVANICEQNDFRYCLIYGTLLGAIRHQGFIPWDDDVDIMMPRPDYDKLLKYFEQHEKELNPLKVFNRTTNRKYLYGITRISDINYEISTENEINCGMGVFIDIYPYDGLGNEKNIAIELLNESKSYLRHIVLSTRKNISIPVENNWKGKLMYLITWIFHHILGPSFYYSRQNKLFRNLPQYDESKYVGPLAWFFEPSQNVIFSLTDFSTLMKAKFDKYEFNIPVEYDKILTQIYGDYMTPPPVEKQIYHHHYKAYKREF